MRQTTTRQTKSQTLSRSHYKKWTIPLFSKIHRLMVSKPTIFEPGSAVEVSIVGGSFHGSWFSGTLISCMDSDKFLVEYHNFGERAVVGLHQLRPLPPPENQPEFKCGDNVEAFRNNCWWEAHVTKDLENGRFLVSFNDSEEMALPKESIRAPLQWINHNWVPSNRDRISDLPDDVLLHIMNFMDTKDAVQTCVLSKRWQHLCKRLTNITFTLMYYKGILSKFDRFKQFACWFLFSRDESYSLRNLTISHFTCPEHLHKIIEHALFCHVQHLKLVQCGFVPTFEPLPLNFCYRSLTSLQLFNGPMRNPPLAVLPKSLHLPALKSLHLTFVQFTPSDNGSAEPFSNCHVLNTLILSHCSLPNDAQVLCISNSTLSSLTIVTGEDCQIVLSTPSICSFTFYGTVGHQLLSTCNFPFLRDVTVEMALSRGCLKEEISILMEWLQVLANVMILTLGAGSFGSILRQLSDLISMGPQPPKFVRLQSLKVDKHLFQNISNEDVKTLVEYLLQNSPMDRVDIISV